MRKLPKKKMAEEKLENQEITIKRAWLETLLRYGKRLEKEISRIDNPTTKSELSSTTIYAVIGYISSAKTLIKYQPKKSDIF